MNSKGYGLKKTLKKTHAEQVVSGPRFEPSTSKNHNAGVPTTLPQQ